MNKASRVAAIQLLTAACALIPMFSFGASAQSPSGSAVFEQRCKTCHDPAIERAPGRTELALRPQADIVRALTNGVMMPMAQGLSAADIQAVAAYLAPESETGVEHRPVGSPTAAGGAEPMCPSSGTLTAGKSDWPSFGMDESSSHFQPNPGLKSSDVPKLELKWSFAMAGGGQPVVIGDWLFVTNRSGKFYALDAKSGCVHWVTDNIVSRTTPMVIRSDISPSGWATFVAIADRTVRAFDAQTGKELWKSDVLEDHSSSVLSGSPVISGDRIFVPISSIEEATSMRKEYVCCTFRGSLASLDLKTGKRLWKTYMITAPMQDIHRDGAEKDLRGPAGAAVWAAPTVDKKRGLVYVVTGDSYTDIETDGADAVVAIDMELGTVRWRTQVTQHDNFVMGCGARATSGNCPTPVGPDYDFGSQPILMTLKGGKKQVLVAGQKSGVAYGFDPDSGALQWKTAVGEGSALGGIEWGFAADRELLYIPVSDIGRILRFNGPADQSPGKPGLSALDPATGKIVWQHPAPVASCHYAADKEKPSVCVRAQSAQNSVMPGIVFSGTLDGWFRGYDTKSGKIVWEYSTTAQTYDTVNGVKGQPGGGIDGMGPTIAGGMVYTMSGFNGAARVGSNGTNVLLAFGLPGKH
jgi:polyvinyl alcohol dehydrogenase (cytochrome)